MEQHYQEQYQCNVCKREFVVDITSVGTGHQIIRAVTCKGCAVRIMKPEEIEEPKLELTDYGNELLKQGVIDKEGNIV